MAEAILAIVALGVAVPGIVVSFAQCGDYINSKVKQYKQAPTTVLQVGTFARELNGGRLKEDLALSQWAYSQADVDERLKDVLEDQVERLRTELIVLDKKLDKCYDEYGNLKRAYFFWPGERNLRLSMDELEQWQQSFWHTISLIEMRRRVLPDPLLLTPDRLKTFVQQNGEYCTSLEPQSHMLIAKGQIAENGAVRDIALVIEQKKKISTGVSEVKEIASCLYYQSASGNIKAPGILKCLGYREEPKLELLFEIPSGAGKMQTLESLIRGDSGLAYAGHRPLDHRLRLARQISEAVLSVHTSNRVHKNIRPNTILMVGRPSESASGSSTADLGQPYLTDWTMLRKIDAPSSMVGESDWLHDMYRHPRRQGLQPEKRYNMGHDIYSLGVCLLEIGLWEGLIVSTGEGKMPNKIYRESAARLGLVKMKSIDVTDGAPDEGKAKEIRQLTKDLTRPVIMQRTLQSLAESELPARMGLVFTSIVTACLTCLEGGFGDAKLFDENSHKQAIGLKFNEVVLQPLSNLENGMKSIA